MLVSNIYIFNRIGKNIDHCQQLMKQIQQSMRVFAFILLGTIKSVHVFHGNFGLNSLKKQAIWLPWLSVRIYRELDKQRLHDELHVLWILK